MGEKGKADKERRRQEQEAEQQQQSGGDKPRPSSNLPPALQNEAGPQSVFDPDLGGKDEGMPSVYQPKVVYQLRPISAGQEAFSRPFIITSVDSRNQHCNGFVLLEPGDVTPVNGKSIGGVLIYVEDIPHGGPGQSDSWHYVSKGYTGRGGGFRGNTEADLSPTQDVSEGN